MFVYSSNYCVNFGKENVDYFIVIFSISFYNMEVGINFYINSSFSFFVLDIINRF